MSASGYRIWLAGGSEPVAETFGKTSAVVTGLKPATEYTFAIRAIDTALNRSPASAPLSATTGAVAPGTLLEDFDDGAADGWALDGAAVRGRRLELARWDGTARALSGDPALPAAFAFSARLAASGGGTGNLGRILVRRHADGDGCWIEFGGGDAAPVSLQERSAGQQRTLTTASGWKADRFLVTCDPLGALTLTLFLGQAERTVFTAVATTVAPGGRIGFESSHNSIVIDDVRVVPIDRP